MITMYCRKCGNDVGDDSYCSKCGARVDGFNHFRVDTPREKPVYSGKTVNKLAYCLLAILIGSLGIHRFYAGRTVSGIIYILLCWSIIPGVLGLIEGILALRTPEDAYGNIPAETDSYFI